MEWFVVLGEKPDGPYSLRDLDVKFRTSELVSNALLWKEGMSEWLSAFKIPEVRDLIQSGKSEATLIAAAKKEQVESSSDSENSEQEDNFASEICYFSKNEKVYKVFKDGQWVSQSTKPTAEELKALAPLTDGKSASQIPKPSSDPTVDPLLTEEEILKKEQRKLKRKRAQVNKKQKWQENRQNTFVYAQGLPSDITLEELLEFFKKCGRLAKDPQGEPKIKLYLDKEGTPKGDCRVCYENFESVPVAIDILDQAQIRPGVTIKVEPASFEQKGEEFKPREIKKLDKIEQMRLKA